jgi:hypothetical protein
MVSGERGDLVQLAERKDSTCEIEMRSMKNSEGRDTGIEG